MADTVLNPVVLAALVGGVISLVNYFGNRQQGKAQIAKIQQETAGLESGVTRQIRDELRDELLRQREDCARERGHLLDQIAGHQETIGRLREEVRALRNAKPGGA